MYKNKNLFCTVHGHPLIEPHDDDAYWVTVPVFDGLILGGDDWVMMYVIEQIQRQQIQKHRATIEGESQHMLKGSRSLSIPVPIDRVERDDHQGIFDRAEIIARRNLADIEAGKIKIDKKRFSIFNDRKVSWTKKNC